MKWRIRDRSKPAGQDGDRADNAEPKKKPRRVRPLVATLALLVVAFVSLLWVGYRSPSPGESLSLDRLFTLAAQNKLQSLNFLDQDAVIVGKRCLSAPTAPATAGRPSRCTDLPITFHTPYPASGVTTQELVTTITKESGAKVTVDKQSGVAVARLLTTFVLPLLLLANLFGLILTSKGRDGEVGEIARFGRLGRKRQRTQAPGTGVSFADVAGAEEAVAELREVIDYLQDPARFQAYGAAPPKGVLLFGPPGCGKTLLARATAGESGVPFFSAAGTEFVESLVGVGAARVRDLFRQVRDAAPAILFIDEIDAVGRRRSGEGTSGGEREQTLNQLLVELDGFEVASGIVLMGATNRPDILDPALMRPGRFDRHITLTAPDVEGRQAILEIHAAKRPLAPDVDLPLVARRTPGFTGADLANVINEAALLAIRSGGGAISQGNLSEAILRVLHGPQRRGRLLAPEERRRLAIHEAGHALVAAALGRGAGVLRVSIVARGRGLAQSVVSDEGERAVFTTSEMEAELAMAMAGVAAEVLVLGESSTTALDDIKRATALAREMVGLYGMSDELGRMLLLTQGTSFLDPDHLDWDLVSGPTMAGFDSEVRRLVAGGEARATTILRSVVSRLQEMTEMLQQEETLEGEQLKRFLSSSSTLAGTGHGVNGTGGNGMPPGEEAAPRGGQGRVGASRSRASKG